MGWTGSAPNQTYQRTDGTRTGSAVNVTADGLGINNTAALADARENDLASAINDCWKRDGGNQPSANLPMNTYHFTGMGQGAARTSSVRLDQVQDGDLLYASVGGTANAITLTLTPVITESVAGQQIIFIPASDNTGATTVNVNGIGAIAVEYNNAALTGGEFQSGQPAIIINDGSVWNLANPYVGGYASSSNLASTANGKGASLIGIEDSGNLITATTVEGALAENRAAIDAAEADIAAIEADYVVAADLAAYQPVDADLTAIAALSGTNGVLKKTSANTWAIDQFTTNLTFIKDNNGTVLATGVMGDITVPFACTITGVSLLADQTGSAVVDIWKDTYANYPATVADTITASAKPTLSSATKYTDTTLTGWTTSIAAGDTIRFNLDSVTSITRLTIVLTVRRFS